MNEKIGFIDSYPRRRPKSPLDVCAPSFGLHQRCVFVFTVKTFQLAWIPKPLSFGDCQLNLVFAQTQRTDHRAVPPREAVRLNPPTYRDAEGRRENIGSQPSRGRRGALGDASFRQ